MPTTIPTADELYAIARAEVVARDALLTDWNEGSALDAITGSGVVLADQVIRICIDLFRARFVATAVGSDLDAAVVDLYPSLTRNPAAGSVGTLTFNRGTNTGIVTIPAGTQCKGTYQGVTLAFATDVAASIPSANSTVNVTATCTLTGPATNISAALVVTIVSAIPDNAAANMTVTNGERFVGGVDVETDDAYRARAQAYPSTLSLGTIAAVELACLAVPGLAYATVDESVSTVTYVYVAAADGNGNAAQVALAQVAVDAVRASGCIHSCVAASRQEVDLSITVYVQAGRASESLRSAISAAVLAYTGKLAASASLYFSAAEAAAIGVSSYVLGAVATSTAGTGNAIVPASAANALRVASTALAITLVEV